MTINESNQFSTFGKVIITIMVFFCLCSASYASETDTQAKVSQFTNEVVKEKYDKIAPPSAAQMFYWDFSKSNTVYTYSYEELLNEYDNERISNEVFPKMSTKGKLLLKSLGDTTAELMLNDFKMNMKMEIGKDENVSMEHQIPPLTVKGIKKDGTGSFRDNEPYTFFKIFFYLPNKPIKVGEYVEFPEQKIITPIGETLKVTGVSRVTLTQYVKIGNHTCAQFDIDTDISKLSVPLESKAKYKYSIKEKAVFFFDITSHCLVSGTMTSITQHSIDALIQAEKRSGESTSKEPKRFIVSEVEDKLIKVRLNE